MAEKIKLSVAKREVTGKGAMRKLRAQEKVPGVFYAKGENIMIQVDPLPLDRAYAKAGTSQLVYLTIEGEKTHPVLIRELIRHPYKNFITHVDFYGVDLTHSLRVRVPIETTGTAKGEKEGGVLAIYRDGLDVECLPTDIPDNILLDVSDLDVNDSINIEDIPMPEGVTALYEENFAVLGVVVPSAVEEPTDEEEEDLEGEEEAEGEEEESEEE